MIGVASRQLVFDGQFVNLSRTGSTLAGIGSESAQVLYEAFEPPPPVPDRRVTEDRDRDPVPSPIDRVAVGVEGSLLVFPAVDVKWSVNGTWIHQDSFVELVNDSDEPVTVRLYLVNGDPPLDASPFIGERAHLGWNHLTEDIVLTPHQPTYWSASTGAPVGLPAWTELDPGSPNGRPNPDGSSTRVQRGFIYAWAVNNAGEEIRHDHLSGRVTTINYVENTGWEHDAYAFRVADPAVAPGEPTGTPGVLHLDGNEFVACFNQLMLNFQAVGSDAYSSLRTVITDTDLTLFPVSIDLTSATDLPVITKAHFTVYNMNEVQFSGAHRCVTGWDQTLLSDYGIPNHFFIANLQTDQGWARIEGFESMLCWGSEDAALLGVAARQLTFDDDFAIDTTGSTFSGRGIEAATIQSGPYTECLTDQDQPLATVPMAAFSQTDLAQSFVPAQDNIGGAGIFLFPSGAESDLVTIGLWDGLPNAGGTLLAEGSAIGERGTWIDVEWTPVPVTPGETYYLVFTGNETMIIAGDTGNPYPHGQVYANPGFQPFPVFDYTFRTCWVPENEFKQVQTLSCASNQYFSNLNSAYSTWMRYDDFICAQTGDIQHISFWGAMIHLIDSLPCDDLTNLAGIEINIYTWEPGGECGWQPGALLCSNYIAAEDLHPFERCTYDFSVVAYRLSADLPEPCFQQESEHYVIRIAAELDDPEDVCVFAWASTGGFIESEAFSTPSANECLPNTADAAFLMLTLAANGPDLNGDGVVDVDDLLIVLSAWGPCPDPPDPCLGDLTGDGVVDVNDLLALIAAWGPAA
jgi:hypothetical protein